MENPKESYYQFSLNSEPMSVQSVKFETIADFFNQLNRLVEINRKRQKSLEIKSLRMVREVNEFTPCNIDLDLFFFRAVLSIKASPEDIQGINAEVDGGSNPTIHKVAHPKWVMDSIESNGEIEFWTDGAFVTRDGFYPRVGSILEFYEAEDDQKSSTGRSFQMRVSAIHRRTNGVATVFNVQYESA